MQKKGYVICTELAYPTGGTPPPRMSHLEASLSMPHI